MDNSVLGGRCRPDRSCFGFAAFFAAFAGGSDAMAWAVCHTPPVSMADMAVVISLAVFVNVPTLALIWHLVHAECRWDADGLQVRSLGSWRHLPWADIADFYERPGSKRVVIAIVESTDGRRWRFPPMWNAAQLEALKAAVAASANRARVHSWGVIGCRTDDRMALTFRYDVSSTQIPAVLCAAMPIWLGVLFAGPSIGRFNATTAAIGVGWACGSVAVGLLLPAALALYAWSVTMIALNCRSRRRQFITTSRDGIVFDDGAGRRVEVAWNGVRRHYQDYLPGRLKIAGRCVVETDLGTFDFTQGLRDLLILRRVLEFWAGPDDDTEAPDTCSAPYTPPADVVRDLREVTVYTFRSSTCRALLTMIYGYCFLFIVVSVLNLFGITRGPHGPTNVAIIIIGTIVAAWFAYCYRKCAVITDADGITFIGPLAVRRLRWSEIRECSATSNVMRLIGDRSRIVIYQGVVNATALRHEISARRRRQVR
jgi:hypothetical protein